MTRRRELVNGIEFGPEPQPEPVPVAAGQETMFDDELGTLRLCAVCREWWPDDGEFYAADGLPCRACQTELEEAFGDRRVAQVRAAARRYRARRRQQVPA